MSDAKPTSVQEVRSYFLSAIEVVLRRRQVATEPKAAEYLVDLLLAYQKSEVFFRRDPDSGRLENEVMAFLYGDAVNDPAHRPQHLKRLGDLCLLVTGLFPDSVRRKLVDLDYYFGMGNAAYTQLAEMQMTDLARVLYKELGEKFVTFSNVLSEVTEPSGIQNDKDLIRLYERWLLTKSERIRELLNAHGIVASADTTKKSQ